MIILAFFLAHWYLSVFFQTFFLHRYASHHMFSMSKFWERVFFFLTFIAQGANYLSAYGYGILHRMHHAFADTENDPHSPKYSPSMIAMMWKTKTVYSAINNKEMKVEDRFLRNAPEWASFDKFAGHNLTRIAWGVLYVLFYLKFATAWWMFLLLPIHFFMAPIHGAIINWFAHKFGYKTHAMSNTSANLLPLDVLMMGESYHNNHHKNDRSANFGERWHEIDPTYYIILILNAFRIIRLKKS